MARFTLHNLQEKINETDNRTLVRLFIFFFIGRLAFGVCYGTQDVEWWKAWSTDAIANGVTNVYGSTDQGILDLYKAGKTTPEVRAEAQKVIPFTPYNYGRLEYKVTQPPLYMYAVLLEGLAYKLFNPALENGRLFNFFLNLFPILFSALTALAIFRFVKSIASEKSAYLAAGIYWLSPLAILNSPVQGYYDPLIAFFTTMSVIYLYEKKLMLSYIFIVLAVLSKPTAIIVFPVIAWVGLKEHSFKQNIITWAASLVVVIVAFLPYIFTNHSLSVLLGVSSITDSSNDLSRQAMNLWWPVQYFWTAFQNLGNTEVSKVAALMGGPGTTWFNDVPAVNISNLVHFNIKTIGFVLLAVFTVLNLRFVSRNLETDRKALFLAVGLQAYAYFILMVGVQGNHYFVMVPLMAIAALSPNRYRYYLLATLILFLQDFIFYGLGRDFNPGKGLLTMLYSGWLTNVLALCNLALFWKICSTEFSEKGTAISTDKNVSNS